VLWKLPLFGAPRTQLDLLSLDPVANGPIPDPGRGPSRRQNLATVTEDCRRHPIFTDGVEIISTHGRATTPRPDFSSLFRTSSVKMHVLGQLIALAFCTIIVVQTYHHYRASITNFFGLLGFCIVVLGMLGFLGAGWIYFFPPEFLDRFELPNDRFEGVRFTAPDGRVFMASPALARVQRYGPEGFEKGFSYGHKASKFGMSASGNILICAAGGVLLTYSPDGAELPLHGSCPGRFEFSSPSYPSHARVPAIAFNWFSAWAVPLWHPFAGWFTAAFGSLILKLSSLRKSKTL
jgi:hypothetical protein